VTCTMSKQTSSIFSSLSSKGKSPDVSPGTQTSPRSTPSDYFSAERDRGGSSKDCTAKASSNPAAVSRSVQIYDSNSPNLHRACPASTTSPTASPLSPEESGPYDSRRSSSASNSAQPEGLSRKSSVASVTFRAPQNKSLPQGHQRRTDGRRLRVASPEPVK
jgi:hypothetical protein